MDQVLSASAYKDPSCPRCNPERRRGYLCQRHGGKPKKPKAARKAPDIDVRDLVYLGRILGIVTTVVWGMLLGAIKFAAAPRPTWEPPVVSKGEEMPRFPDDLPLRRPVQMVVRARIDTQGRPSKVVLLEPSGIDLADRRVLQAAERFRYMPARADGVPVAMEWDFVFSYAPSGR